MIDSSIVYYILLLLIISNLAISNDRTGHLKPLGEQHACEGHIEVREDIPDPITFHEKYILASKPVVFKGAAKDIPAFKLWTDEYMKTNFGDLKCDVEEGKKENRSQNMWKWNYKTFLEKYQTEDVYMVNSLRGPLLNDLRLFPCLSCGGYTKVLTDVIMWFSSGGTKSVLHNDQIDNINCLFSGVKELYMVDKVYEEFIDFDEPGGSYSKVDVDSVDLDKYPGLAQAPWWKAKMEAGDCLFIPTTWFHQVRSYATDNRNMAVNIWFSHLPKINKTDCLDNPEAGKFKKFEDDIVFGGDHTTIKFLLKLELQDGRLGYRAFKRAIKKHAGGQPISKKLFSMAIKVLDQNKDKYITEDEVDALEKNDFDIIKPLFPGVGNQYDEEEGYPDDFEAGQQDYPDEHEANGHEEDENLNDGNRREEL